MLPGESFLEDFGRFSEVSRIFLTGVSHPSGQVRGEFWSNPKFRKMSQIGQGGPPRHPFCFFMPGDGFGRPGSDFGSPGQHVGPGTKKVTKNGPEKSCFVEE